MQNKRSPIPNQQSCTELTLYVGGVQRGIRSRSLEKTYTEENVSKLFMKEVLFINFEIIIIFKKNYSPLRTVLSSFTFYILKIILTLVLIFPFN